MLMILVALYEQLYIGYERIVKQFMRSVWKLG